MKLLLGNCLDRLKELNDNSVDSVITDPPYGLKFMGKKWDYEVPSIEIWREVLRVLKPAGHLLSFGGTRTYHRMVGNIEDAGFEIRDQIQWLYGSGFPKSHNISKAIDKNLGKEREKVRELKSGKTSRAFQSEEETTKGVYFETRASSSLARKWEGFGTALKPANEPICLARKPLSEKTIVDNVLKWGTGGLNIDGCRIETKEVLEKGRSGRKDIGLGWGHKGQVKKEVNTQGRFPANLILDEKAGEILGDPARFFYCAKASKKERGEENNHPTVKPIKLMSYLCRLITPPMGIVLDPFMGSGSTALAAKKEGFDFIGIEMNEKYLDIAKNRIESIKKELYEISS